MLILCEGVYVAATFRDEANIVVFDLDGRILGQMWEQGATYRGLRGMDID